MEVNRRGRARAAGTTRRAVRGTAGGLHQRARQQPVASATAAARRPRSPAADPRAGTGPGSPPTHRERDALAGERVDVARGVPDQQDPPRAAGPDVLAQRPGAPHGRDGRAAQPLDQAGERAPGAPRNRAAPSSGPPPRPGRRPPASRTPRRRPTSAPRRSRSTASPVVPAQAVPAARRARAGRARASGAAASAGRRRRPASAPAARRPARRRRPARTSVTRPVIVLTPSSAARRASAACSERAPHAQARWRGREGGPRLRACASR